MEVRKFLMSKSKQLDLVFLSLSMNDLNEGMNLDDTFHHAEKLRAFYEFPPILWPNQMHQQNQGFNRGTNQSNNQGSIRITNN